MRAVALVTLLALAGAARGEPLESHRTNKTEARCHTEAGTEFVLDPRTHLVSDAAWLRLDAEMRRLQEQETRLEAQNASLRDQLRAKFSGAAWWIGGALLAGAAVGVGLEMYRESR